MEKTIYSLKLIEIGERINTQSQFNCKKDDVPYFLCHIRLELARIEKEYFDSQMIAGVMERGR